MSKIAKLNIKILIVFLFLTSGCVSYRWVKIGGSGTKAELDADLNSCKMSAFSQFPINLVTTVESRYEMVTKREPSSTYNTTCKRDYYGQGEIKCESERGPDNVNTTYEKVPHKVTKDVNEALRDEYTKGCMGQRGWLLERAN